MMLIFLLTLFMNQKQQQKIKNFKHFLLFRNTFPKCFIIRSRRTWFKIFKKVFNFHSTLFCRVILLPISSVSHTFLIFLIFWSRNKIAVLFFTRLHMHHWSIALVFYHYMNKNIVKVERKSLLTTTTKNLMNDNLIWSQSVKVDNVR